MQTPTTSVLLCNLEDNLFVRVEKATVKQPLQCSVCNQHVVTALTIEALFQVNCNLSDHNLDLDKVEDDNGVEEEVEQEVHAEVDICFQCILKAFNQVGGAIEKIALGAEKMEEATLGTEEKDMIDAESEE